MDEKLYISGGISTYKENFRDGWIYLCMLSNFPSHPILALILNSIGSSAVMVDLSGGVTYPVKGDNSVFSYGISPHASGESTQMGAFWWDGSQSIYKYASVFMFLIMNLLRS